MPIISRVDVSLDVRSYPILIGSGILDDLGSILRQHGLRQTTAFVITNPTIGGLLFESVASSLELAGFQRVVRHDIPASEEGKNWEELSKAAASLVTSFPDAAMVPLVLLLGGGVVGDLGGFAAGIFRRGVQFVQIPTTLLAAVDSSVGGKVAVNFAGVKNILGTFAQPRLVFCDLNLLGSLPEREVRSGVAEIIKYGAVCSAALFKQLERGDLERLLSLDLNAVADIVAQCCQLKATIVEKDELDRLGIRNVLNFGHTIGHALELSANYELTHGEAISIGMIAAARLAIKIGKCDGTVLQRIQGLVERAKLPTSFPNQPGLYERVLEAMQSDKKFRDGKNLFVVPTAIGSWTQQENVDWPIVHEAVRSVLVP